MTARDLIWAQDGSYSATEDRQALAALFGARLFTDLAPQAAALVSAGGGHGVVGANDLLVTQNGTPNMTVLVAAGQCVIRGTQQGDQGVYIGANDASFSVAIAAADGTNARKDLIVARATDTDYGAGATALVIEAVTGTAAGSPSEPVPPENSLVIALVDVPAGDTAIGSAQITDRRTRAYALGGVAVCTSTTRPNPVTEGQVIYEIDTNRLYVYDGAAWKFLRHTGNENRVVVAFIPGGVLSATGSAAWADWIACGNITVPAWAATADVSYHLSNIYDDNTAIINDYFLRPKIGTAEPTSSTGAKGPGDLHRFSVSAFSRITLTATGSLAFNIQAFKVSGDGVLKADTSSRVHALIEFLP